MKRKGVKVEFIDVHSLKEGGYMTAGQGTLSVANRAPHPNATKVYVNWLLSREGQLAYSKASGYVSRRVDVPQGHIRKGLIPKKDRKYIEIYRQQYQGKLKDEMNQFLKSVIGSR